MSDAPGRPDTLPIAPLIGLRGVTVSTGGYDALKEVTASFPEGTSTVIMGPSGCGKSTLLKVAAGLIPPDKGTVLHRGDDIYGLSAKPLAALRRASGFVFQDAALWENKSIAENLALPLQVRAPRMERAELERRVVRALEKGGLADSASLRPAQMSAGERKIVSFLRALVNEPTLLFLDEPTLSVDGAAAERMDGMIRDLKARGCSIVAVTHDSQLASTLADRLLVLAAGTVAAEGTFDEVKANPDPRVRGVLVRVLGEIASFDTDLLDLLGSREN
jgi:ABC-type transporter Mla maintaining outer membrane lipid asymmetry ATPase subunit MlaF